MDKDKREKRIEKKTKNRDKKEKWTRERDERKTNERIIKTAQLIKKLISKKSIRQRPKTKKGRKQKYIKGKGPLIF